MSATREMIAELRRRLGEDDPLPKPDTAQPLTPRPQAVFPTEQEHSPFQAQAAAHTTALLGIGQVGTRYATQVALQFQAELAVAKHAVASELPAQWREQNGLLALNSRVQNSREYLLRPDLGRRLDPSSLQLLQSQATRSIDLQPLLADGLLVQACVHLNVANSLSESLEFGPLGPYSSDDQASRRSAPGVASGRS